MNSENGKSRSERKKSLCDFLCISNEERAKRFKYAREQAGIKNYEDAETLSDVPVSTIWKLENGKMNVNVGYRSIVALAQAYKVNVAWLLGQSDSPSLDEDNQTATMITGLSADAVRILQTMKETRLIDSLNSLLESDGFMKMLIDFDTARKINADSTETKETANLIDGLTQWGTLNGMDSRNNRVSDHQLIDMYLWKASQEIGNTFRQIMKGDKDNGER